MTSLHRPGSPGDLGESSESGAPIAPGTVPSPTPFESNTPELQFQTPFHSPMPNSRNEGGERRQTLHRIFPGGSGHKRKSLVLCFDGTGNKFKGNSGDTNILKIFRMLDRRGGDQFHYYQPGIGTYITNGTLSRAHVGSRVKSWYKKAMDAAIGTSFDEHVIGGYKFLMRFYAPGDDIYMFGFSRGAYTARFLAEMLDHVGLVSQGNEEMILFAWKTFSNWQQRQSNIKKDQLYNYMRAFRETFARPVRRVRFLGLFDTVNSVPRFEQAWLKRAGGFPYTARSSARVIRHAVGIDERRAKFRQDLIEKADKHDRMAHRRSWKIQKKKEEAKKTFSFLRSGKKTAHHDSPDHEIQTEKRLSLSPNDEGGRQRRYSSSSARSNRSPVSSVASSMIGSLDPDISCETDSEDDDETNWQDIEEVWFPGAHGDIGGGWDLPVDEEPLSHGPLVWMVREARRAGVRFDAERMRELNCWIPGFEDEFPSAAPSVNPSPVPTPGIPQIQVTSDSPLTEKINPLIPERQQSNRAPPPEPAPSELLHSAREYLERSYTRGKIHDCLLFNNGLSHFGVFGWKVMEYLPFRRMDLQSDGSWKPIIWPLPMGEVRDVPENVKIHVSVLKRMQADPTYRPGNLLIGGGGRGVRKAPEHVGTGEWVVVKNPGDPVGELLMKKTAWEKMVLERHESHHSHHHHDYDREDGGEGVNGHAVGRRNGSAGKVMAG